MGQIDLTPIRKHNPKVSRRLAAVIEKAMELRPEQRYQNAEDFNKALINTRVITGKRAAKEMTLAPVVSGAEAANNYGQAVGTSSALFSADNQADQGSVSIGSPAVKSGEASIDSTGSLYTGKRRMGCWLSGVLLLVLIAAVVGVAYIFQPGLVNQSIGWIPGNILSIAGLASSNTPTSESEILSPTPNLEGTSLVIAADQTATPIFTSPTPSPANEGIFSTPTITPTRRPQPTATFTAAPTAIGGGAGQIAFASDLTGLPQIYLMNSDGTSPHQITDMPEGACQPAWSPDGERLAFIAPCGGNQEIYPGAGIFIINADGTDLFPMPSVPGGDFDPAWSPDGIRIAFTSLRDFNRAQIYEFNLQDNSTHSISENFVRDSQPAWSPDGKEIAFITTRRGPYQIWIMDRKGEDAFLLSRSGSLKDSHPEWSPDGQVIMFTQNELIGGVPRLVAMRVEEGNLIENRVIREIIPMREASYSPDGTWIAFESWPEGSNHDIYIMTSNGLARQRLTDLDGFEFDAVWRP
jgi:hypothetical protein